MWISRKHYDHLFGEMLRAKVEACNDAVARGRAEVALDRSDHRVGALIHEQECARAHHEDLAELVERWKVQNELKTERIASLEKHLQWLSEHVSRVESERAMLLQKIGIGAVPMSVSYRAAPDAGSEILDAFERAARNIVGTPHEESPAAMEHDLPEDSMPSSLHQALSFEDMGDDAAGRAGIKTEPDGTVTYTR